MPEHLRHFEEKAGKEENSELTQFTSKTIGECIKVTEFTWKLLQLCVLPLSRMWTDNFEK